MEYMTFVLDLEVWTGGVSTDGYCCRIHQSEWELQNEYDAEEDTWLERQDQSPLS